MRPPRALYLTLWATLPLAGCGPGELAPSEVQASEQEPPIDMEGMEDWAYLLGHTTPFESATEWDGDLDGFKTEWHANGGKSGEGEYRDSKRVGAWTFWHENGNPRWQGTYAADIPTGLERAWYEDGKPAYEGHYQAGLRHGTFTYWYPSGQLWWKGAFEQDKREGLFMQWQRDGTGDAHESGIYVNGVKTADAQLEGPPSPSNGDVESSGGSGDGGRP